MTTDARYLGMRLRNREAIAIQKVKRAFKQANGSLRGAAEILGVSVTCLNNWVRLPCLKDLKRRTPQDNTQNFGRE